jgi:hypothetical protein
MISGGLLDARVVILSKAKNLNLILRFAQDDNALELRPGRQFLESKPQGRHRIAKRGISGLDFKLFKRGKGAGIVAGVFFNSVSKPGMMYL